MASSSSRRQPPWEQPPKLEGIPPLQVYNSLTRSKVPFYPIEPPSKVQWYCCGPTVYADAHLGHARNYVTTDILRRIMKDFFKYDVKFVMNITDIDDKIILRARQQHVFNAFVTKNPDLDSEVMGVALNAFRVYTAKNLPLISGDVDPTQWKEASKAYGPVLEGHSLEGKGVPPGDKEAKIKMHLQAAGRAAAALSHAQDDRGAVAVAQFFNETEDIITPLLDGMYGANIDPADYSIFTKLSQKYEDRFNEDMRALNCLDADLMPRVTDYVPQIVSFVERMMEKGFAYQTAETADLGSSSVYFDITAFEAAGKPYARLEPWNRGNQDLQADGEGALTKKTSEKRSDADFALWKASKPGEPSWPSPWGKGRPGWHIECSAMASELLGDRIDIHSGGIDLCFPHHDNELAQSEAYWAAPDGSPTPQWINYFIHMGHLSIAGSKMSKSLKNFTTIREALEKGVWTPRGLRIVFLLGGWKDGVEITDQLVRMGSTWENKMQAFLLNAKDLEKSLDLLKHADSERKASNGSNTVSEALEETKVQFHNALCDSFDTPTAMALLSSLISTANKANSTDPSLLSVARWVTTVVHMFGLDSHPPPVDGIGWSGMDIPEEAKPHIYPLSRIRDGIRQRAISGSIQSNEIDGIFSAEPVQPTADQNSERYALARSQFEADARALASKSAPAKEFLELTDQLRDTHLWSLGVYLEDRDSGKALVRPLDKEDVAAREDQKGQEAARLAAKQERERQAKEKLEAGRMPPSDMFKNTDEFTDWDAEGLPTKDKEGKEIAKSRSKKLKKEQERQAKLHATWLKAQGGS